MGALPPDFELVTTRCRLRAPSAGDIPFIFSATRVPGFNEGMAWDAPDSEAELAERFHHNQRAWARKEEFTFTIDALDSDVFLGRIVIRKDQKAADGTWNIGYWIHPYSQSRGYATEAGRAVVDFGFDRLEASVITAAAATWNVASERVLEKLGMKLISRIPHGFLKRGEWVAEHGYAISRGDWLAAR